MKRFAAILLIVMLCIPAMLMTACKDPLEAKMKELDDTYALMGTRYITAVEVCELAGVYEGDEAVAAKFAEWKQIIRDAGNTVDMRLEYTKEEMDEFIAQWTAVIADIEAIIAQYQIVEETTAAETTVAA